jgi:predicted nucleotidyltransferase
VSTNLGIDQISSDWRDLLSALETEGVRFLMIGGYAVMRYTEPYHTKDLDLWVEPSPGNAARLLRALVGFGAPIGDLEPEFFTMPGNFYQIGVSRWRVDILTSVSSELPFESAWERRVQTTLGGFPLFMIGLDDLIAVKEAAGRPRDVVAVEDLKKRRDELARRPKDAG